MGILELLKKWGYPQENIQELIKLSFTNVKRDTDLIFQWITFLNQKIQEQEQLIYRLQAELSELPKTKDSIRELIDSYYVNKGIFDRLKSIEHRIDNLHTKKSETGEQSEELKAILKRLETIEQKRQSVKHKIIEKIAKNTKEQVKSVMLSLIKKYEKIPAYQMRDIIVEEKRLCSRSSFYRILEEIEDEDSIGVVKERKEKYYLSNIPRSL